MLSLNPRHHPHRFLTLILLIMFSRGIMLMCILPALEGWDEHQHIAYIDFLIRHHRPPIAHKDSVPIEIQKAAAAYPQSDYGAMEFPGYPVQTYAQYFNHPHPDITATTATTNSPPPPYPLYQAQHPPLYYTLMIPFYQLAGGAQNIVAVSSTLRLINLLIQTLALALFTLAFRELAKKPDNTHADWWIPAAALLALQPLFLLNAIRAANDPLSIAAAGLVTLLAARCLTSLTGLRPFRYHLFLLLGAAAGLLVWTKITTLAFWPAVLLLPLLFGHKSPNPPTAKQRALALLLTASALALVAAPYILQNLRLYGTFLPMEEFVSNQEHGKTSLADQLHAITLIPWFNEFRKWWFGPTLWMGAWSYLPAPMPLRILYELLLVTALTAAAYRCLKPRRASPTPTPAASGGAGHCAQAIESTTRSNDTLKSPTPPAALLALLIILSLSFALFVKAIQSQLLLGQPITNPYYADAARPLELLLLAIGITSLTPKTPRRLNPATLLLFSFLLLYLFTDLYESLHRLPTYYAATKSLPLAYTRLAQLHPPLLGLPTLFLSLLTSLTLTTLLLKTLITSQPQKANP